MLMITETIKESGEGTQNREDYRLLRIIKQTKQQLLLTDGSKHMIFKTFHSDHLPDLAQLRFRMTLSHEALIRINKVEFQEMGQSGGNRSTKCGILFEKYEKTLAQGVKEMVTFTHEEVFQTMQPIKQAIDHLVSNHYDPGPLSLNSIVCSENYEIKLMDAFFHEEKLTLHQRPDFKTLLYEELVALLFNLFFPRQVHIKSWKSRFEIAEKHLEPHHFKHFEEVYQKFAPTFVKTEKSKKIKKDEEKSHRQRQTECKRSKRLKDKTQKRYTLEHMLKSQEGKQNKRIQ